MPNGTTPTWIAAITAASVAVVGIVVMPFRFLHVRVTKVEARQQWLEVNLAERLARIETLLGERACMADSDIGKDG